MGKQSYFMDPGFNSKNFFYGLKNLNDIRISNYNDFKKLIEKVIFLSKKKKYKKNIYCLKSDRVSERVYQYFKKVI